MKPPTTSLKIAPEKIAATEQRNDSLHLVYVVQTTTFAAKNVHRLNLRNSAQHSSSCMHFTTR
ncbi:MAG: hypothetical protein JSS82_12850 [Bacteroidetes bacterium]|nr:hypothetical protein [Bacteroidota bacterium]